jgi:hypothetical protein
LGGCGPRRNRTKPQGATSWGFVEAQAIDRTHRIGQERILRADRSLLQDLTRKDLRLLLS